MLEYKHNYCYSTQSHLENLLQAINTKKTHQSANGHFFPDIVGVTMDKIV